MINSCNKIQLNISVFEPIAVKGHIKSTLCQCLTDMLLNILNTQDSSALFDIKHEAKEERQTFNRIAINYKQANNLTLPYDKLQRLLCGSISRGSAPAIANVEYCIMTL